MMKKKHNVNSGQYFAQRKYDGTRMLARWEGNKVVLYSRSGKIYDIKHISDELANFMDKDSVFDGEAYIHGVPLQSVISLIKKPQPESIKIEYHVYDMPVVKGKDELGFADRYNSLVNSGIADLFSVKIVPSVIVNGLDHMKQLHTDWVADGYEGLMLREKNSLYLWGYRSSELLKFKTFLDSEFTIIDVIEGVGKMAGHGIFVCQNDLSNGAFKAVPKMTMEKRAEIFQNKLDYVGRLLTVKYFDRTEDLIPRFPVALAVRDYE